TINGSPCKINQTASNIIPTDMLSLLVLLDEIKAGIRELAIVNSKLFRSSVSLSSNRSILRRAQDERKNKPCMVRQSNHASFQPFQWFKSFNDELIAFSHFNLEHGTLSSSCATIGRQARRIQALSGDVV
ncbi:MAG TPA: hypothetical protein VGK57_01420, partial [Candidatus Binatia bacterium]